VPEHGAAIRALELIATEVSPALGWKPASAEPAAVLAGRVESRGIDLGRDVAGLDAFIVHTDGSARASSVRAMCSTPRDERARAARMRRTLAIRTHDRKPPKLTATSTRIDWSGA
jgi:hypothetical protein